MKTQKIERIIYDYKFELSDADKKLLKTVSILGRQYWNADNDYESVRGFFEESNILNEELGSYADILIDLWNYGDADEAYRNNLYCDFGDINANDKNAVFIILIKILCDNADDFCFSNTYLKKYFNEDDANYIVKCLNYLSNDADEEPNWAWHWHKDMI